jgi:hypothetical protein
MFLDSHHKRHGFLCATFYSPLPFLSVNIMWSVYAKLVIVIFPYCYLNNVLDAGFVCPVLQLSSLTEDQCYLVRKQVMMTSVTTE